MATVEAAETKVRRCGFLDDGGMQFCAAMDRYVRPSGEGYKGLFLVETFKHDRKPQARTIGVKMRNGAKDNGVMLNVCPWCLEKIQGW